MTKRMLLIVTLFAGLCIPLFTYSQWTKHQAGNEDLKRVTAVGGVGFILSSGTLYNTAFKPLLEQKDLFLIDMYFLDANRGYVIANTSASIELLKTKDGGKTWQTVNANLPNSGRLYFINPDTGFIASDGTFIFRTDDGGATWEIAGNQQSGIAGDVFFKNDMEGYVAGYYPGSITRTRDGGKTWASATVDIECNDIYFPSEKTGYAVGFFGAIGKTTDSGATWQKLVTPVKVTLRSVYCADENTCVAVGDSGTILKTTDGGTTWQIQQSGTKARLRSIACGDSCYIVGDFGIVLLMAKSSSAIREDKSANKLYVYPNPVKDILTIHTEGEAIRDISLLDSGGKRVRIKTVSKSGYEATLNTVSLKPGIYLLNVYTETGVLTEKIMIP